MKKSLFALLIVALFLSAITAMESCHKESFTNKGALSFSTDTLTFDTVFTSLGTTTRSFKVRNTQGKAIQISSIKLMQLQGATFRMNVDGVSGNSFTNVEIPAHDSIYVFVEATINPNSGVNPLLIFDQIQFVTNGTTQQVTLMAYGQNAYYYRGRRIFSGTVTFPTDKPIIILRGDSFPGLEVRDAATLNIAAGTKIFVGPNALISVNGTLNCNGTASDSIIFQGLRLEASYDAKPGQWLGILFGRNNTYGAHINMTHTIVDESYFGVSDEHILNVLAGARLTDSRLPDYQSYPITPTVTLNKTIIRNASSTCLTAFKATLNAVNCLFHSAGGQMVVCGLGGTYNFTHCTLANVNNRYTDHKSESLTLTESLVDIDEAGVGPFAISATVTNCVVYGTLQNELAFSPRNISNVSFQNCLLRIPEDSFHLVQAANNSCIFNQDPLFREESGNDYRPDSVPSPLYRSGTVTSVSDDLRDVLRSTPPDIGALQWP
ncbi:MAG: hypothetical protein U0T73_08900 [Chitinophagales bacterium]